MPVRKWGGEALFVASLGGRNVRGLKGGGKREGGGEVGRFFVGGSFMGLSHGRPAFRGSAGYLGGSLGRISEIAPSSGS